MGLLSSSPMYPWVVRHASWTHDRFQAHADGHTAYFRVRGRNYEGRLFGIGAPVMIRLPKATEEPKLEMRWKPGLWLGKATDSDGHIVGTPDGILVGRSVRPLVVDHMTRNLYHQM